jgi:DNA-binding NarL/FixJ family response regulator
VYLVGEKRVAPIKVLIVDNDDAFCQKARASLENAGGITVVGGAADGQHAIAMIQEMQPDVVLCAVDLEGIAQLRTLSPRTKLIVVHARDQEPLVLDAFKNGALGHLLRREIRPPEIVAAVRAVSRGEAVISSDIAGRILDHVVQERKAFERR